MTDEQVERYAKIIHPLLIACNSASDIARAVLAAAETEQPPLSVHAKDYWAMEQRAEAAERRGKRLAEALQEVAADDDPTDGCAHSDAAKAALDADRGRA